MTDEIRKTTPYVVEWAYNCPYCGNSQGWTQDLDEDDYKNIHTCNKCRKDFKLNEVQ